MKGIIMLNLFKNLWFYNKIPKLTQKQQVICKGQLTPDECLAALKSMNYNQTPGSDGLPVEFYSKLWPDLKDYLVEALNEAYLQGQLSNPQAQGIISIKIRDF